MGQAIKFPSLGMFPGATQLAGIDVVQKSKIITMKKTLIQWQCFIAICWHLWGLDRK